MINVTDRTFKINNTWLGFHMTFFAILRKNLYSEHVLDMLLHYYATKAVEGNDTRPSTGVGQVELARHYFKIIYIGYFSGVVHRRVRKPSTDSVNPLSSSLFILFLEDRLRTRIVYKFSCASCNACYIGEASRHFSTRVHEHLSSDRSSHVYKHLQSSESVVLPPVA